MRVLSLFSGGGLGDLGFMAAGMEIVGQVEIDTYCQKILSLRWPDVPKWQDIREVKGEEVKAKCGAVDLICGGFPCQPFSVAGKQEGTGDNRYLWPEMSRVISEVKPAWIVAENVPGIIPLALDDVLDDLEAKGYKTLTLVFPAHAFGAPHRRDRLWIVGYAEHLRRDAAQIGRSIAQGNDGGETGPVQTGEPARSSEREHGDVANAGGREPGRIPDQQRQEGFKIGGNGEVVPDTGLLGPAQRKEQAAGFEQCGKDVADAPFAGCKDERIAVGIREENARPWLSEWWTIEPPVGRVADGIARRVDRLKLLGNGQVVHCTAWLGSKIMEVNNERIH